jgi:hypothetical protein
VLVEISFSLVGGAAVYNARGQGSNPIKDIVFFGEMKTQENRIRNDFKRPFL